VKQLVKILVKGTPLYHPLRNLWIRTKSYNKEISRWERNGKPVPPPHAVKQRTLRNIANRFGLGIFVETGTYYGDMVEAMKGHFQRIFSIELSEELYRKAKKRFAGEETIELIHGDSGIALRGVLAGLGQPALFWLDGHYSAGVTAKGGKDTPILEELTHIFNAPDLGHVIIIDDARCFGTEAGYPSIEEVLDFIQSKRPHYSISVEDDTIRVAPKKPTRDLASPR
jgi:hypothetical protein